MRLLVLTLLGMATASGAQVALPSVSAAGFGFGSGARRVVSVGGRTTVFFTDGTSLLMSETVDGVLFSGPRPVLPGAAASEGFAVASSGALVGVAWGDLDAGVYTLRYAETAFSTGALAFGPATTLSSSTDLRGGRPALTFTTAGAPALVTVEFNHAYAGPLSGCGPARSYRAAPYYRRGGAWQFVGYGNDFNATVPSSASTAIAAFSADGVVFAETHPGGTNLNTGILDTSLAPTAAELGEPWQLRSDPMVTTGDALSSAPSLTTPTDVHHVYVSVSGAVTYARQDSTLRSNNAAGLDVTTISAAGTSPSLFAPASSTGCYVITWLEGALLRARTFQGSIGTLSPARTLYNRTVSPRSLSLLQRGLTPLLTWQEGPTLYFAGMGDPLIAMVATPATALADGVAMVSVTAGPVHDSCGATVGAGTSFTVSTTAGLVMAADADLVTPGIQVVTDAAGKVTFQLQAPANAVTATAVAAPTAGGEPVSLAIPFTPVADAGAAADAGGEVDAGADDAGIPDAGEAVDAGPDADGGAPQHRTLSVGCSCATSGDAGALGLVAWAWLARAALLRRTPFKRPLHQALGQRRPIGVR